MQSRRAEKTGIDPYLIVGIGYGGPEPFNRRRVFDFTPNSMKLSLPDKPDGKLWPESGGGALFLDFLESELIPRVEQEYSIAHNRKTLFGHSLGGLFTLYTLFNRPCLFQNYFASSPSIWWNERQLLKDEEKFIENACRNHHNQRLFISVGNDEKPYMVRDALELSNRLTPYMNVKTVIVEEENHMSIVPTTLSKGLRFLNEKLSSNRQFP